ncbi:MAG: acyl-CoA dehydrogenase family protein [Bacteroidota bacterium]
MPLPAILGKIRAITEDTIRVEADQIDQQAWWPEKSIRTLQQEGLAGLVIPRESGGLGQGLYGLVQTCEIIGQVSASTALCFGMHCVASAVIAAKATARQKTDFLEPIVQGQHLTTLALSEPGTGAHFYYPQTQLLSLSEEELLVKGNKTFVTNGSQADSYVVSTVGVEPDAQLHQFSCVVIEKTAPGIEWGPPWTGLGMRGNSSRNLALEQVRIPAQHLLGHKGDQLWYIFQVVAPYFLTAMSGTYLGIAQAAFQQAKDHLMHRSHSHSGLSLNQIPHLQHQLGMIWAKIERTRRLMYHAALEGDRGGEEAVLALLSAKAEVAHCVVESVNDAMRLCGGIGYRDKSRFDVLLRDAQAAHIMSPTTDLLYTWMGRALLEQPILTD